VAQQFIAAAEQPLGGAFVFNLGGAPVASTHLARLIAAACPGVQITCAAEPLPFPAGFDDSSLRQAFSHVYVTPLEEGVRQTIDRFRDLLDSGRIQVS
jgi:hypothetical protein